jgi:hypothetical protein
VTSFFVPAREGGVGVIAHGAAVGADSDLLEGSLGAFNGEGKNDSGNDGTGLLYTGRLVLNPFGSPGLGAYDIDRWESPRLAIGGAVSHLSDAAGEVRLPDGGSIALRHPGTTVVGLEAAAKWLGASIQGEAFRSRVDDAGDGPGDVEANGAYAEASFVPPGGRLGFTVRYGAVVTEAAEILSTPRGRFEEWTVGAAYFLHGHRAKVALDWTRFGESVRGAERLEDGVLRLQIQVLF